MTEPGRLIFFCLGCRNLFDIEVEYRYYDQVIRTSRISSVNVKSLNH